jgi:lipid-A-disaccharide synthase
MPPTELLISAGEASGDMYAARLAKALCARADVRLFGMGGPHMREAGVETVVDCAEVSLVGLTEVVRKMPALNRAWRRLMGETRRRRPRFAILTDFPGFHLHLSRALRRKGVRNIYFICPQFWAWRPRRVNLVRRRFVRGLCIFPFEVDFYERAGVRVDWIGHPLAGEVRATMSRAEFAARHGLAADPDRSIVALLPGSRPGELAQHLPRMIGAVARLQGAARGQRQFVLPLAAGLERWQVAGYLASRPDIAIHVVENATYNALAAADLAIVSSGTATVESALLDVPMIVIYRVAPTTAWIARRLVRTPFFAMVNLIAERRVVPELIQDDFTPERVAHEAERLLGSTEARAEMRQGLALVRERLGPPGAIERAARIIAGMLAE